MTYFKHDGTWNYPANPETKKKVVYTVELYFRNTTDKDDRSSPMGTRGSMRAHSRRLKGDFQVS